MRLVDQLTEQVRALKSVQDKQGALLDETVKGLQQAQQNTPTVMNYVDNSDFSFTQGGYDTFGYSGAADDAARWYTRSNVASGVWTENTNVTQSPDAFTFNAALDSYWEKNLGIAIMGGDGAIAAPLPKNVAFPGLALYAIIQFKLNAGASFDPTYKFKVSIWDNTSGVEKTIESAPFNVSLTKNGTHPGGANTRKYILRVNTNSSFFYSDVITPAQVTNCVPVDLFDNVNSVTVRWTSFPEATGYRLYRYDSGFGEWREVGNIENGAVQFTDVGGRGGAIFTPPIANVNQKAEAFLPDLFGQFSEDVFQSATFTIRIPSTYAYAGTTDKQWFRMEIVDSNNDPVAVAPQQLLLDKIALGYTSGRWSLSAKDLEVPTIIVTQDPPPVQPPGDYLPPPDDGGSRQNLGYENYYTGA